jgi:hypothetical protein
MAIPLTLSEVPDVTPYIQYVSAASQTVFPYPFPITQDSDLVAVVNGVTLNTDSGYTLSGQGNDNGGNLTFTLGQTAGTIVTLYRDIAIERITQIGQNSGFSSTAFNAEFNNLYLIAQQLESSIVQCLQIPNTNNPTPVTTLTPASYANKYLSFDAFGNPQPAALTSSGSLTGSLIASLLSLVTTSAPTADKVETTAELAYGATIVNYSYSPGDPRRYDQTGGTDYTNAFITSLGVAQDTRVAAGTYPISGLISLASVGSTKTLFFYPGVKIISSQAPTTALGIFQFTSSGTIDRLRIVGNGVQLSYSSAPTTRINHVIYINAAAITNLEIEGLDILNGGNMGVAVFAGAAGTSATGSTGAYIHDCKIANTLGDGVHVENFDSDVRIRDIDLNTTHDDGCAVVNYTGTSGAATHASQTVGVSITKIRGKQVQTSTVAVAGVSQFVVDDIQEEADTSHSVLTLKFTASTGYTVGNSAGVIDNIVTTGATKVLAMDAPGAVTSTAGTNFQQDIRIGQIVGHNVLNQAVSLSNSGTAGGGQIANIRIESLELRGSGLAASQIGFISNCDNISLGNVYADSFGTTLQIANSTNISWDSMKMREFVSSTAVALQITGCTVSSAGSLDIDATNCTTGVQYQSNTLTVHNGLWNVVNGTAQYLFGSNTNVRGFFDVSNGYVNIGTVTGGGTATLTYTRAAPSGSAFVLNVSVYSDAGARWGVKNVLGNQATMLWTDSSTTVYIGYTFSVQAA